MQSHGLNGRRPWAYWAFDIGEPRPSGDAETIRLAELGLLTDQEREVIARRATDADGRIGTESEHISALGTRMEQRPDREAVALDEKVNRLPGQSGRRA
jgi:hypothetical protein